MCLYPTLIKNRRYTATKKNGGIIPPITDPRTEYVPIGCQDCMECRKQKAREWMIRLMEDIKTHKNGKFVTFTFSNEAYTDLAQDKTIAELDGYARENAIATLATRRFLERWRKQYKKSLRHWLVTELGHNGTENIHIHGIVWTDITLREVERIWQYGFVWKGKEMYSKITKKIQTINYVSDKTVNYITKYVTKKDERNKLYKSIILTSPGIGHNYTSTFNARRNAYVPRGTNETYRTSTGHKIALPIYWRNKIYTEQVREQLWLEKLDRNQRFICGEMVNVKNGEEEYWKLLKYYQEKNTKLGYGNGQHTWEQEQYELQRRNMLNAKRMANTRSIYMATRETRSPGLDLAQAS